MNRNTERLDRRLAHATGMTRSQAQRAIRSGAVTVDGVIVTDPSSRIAVTGPIALDGEPLAATGQRYCLLHKPLDYVCTADDAHHPSALRLIDLPDRERLHFAGRLDADTTGLVLVTDDGDWSHRVTAPRHKQPKTYLVTLAEPVDDATCRPLETGLLLNGENKPTRPATIEILAPTQIRITLHEGRYHQVRRMFAAIGNHVLALHRERIGPLTLEGLASGEWRELTAEEVAVLAGRPD